MSEREPAAELSPLPGGSDNLVQIRVAGLWHAVLDPQSKVMTRLDLDDACLHLLGYTSLSELDHLSFPQLFESPDVAASITCHLVQHRALRGFETRLATRNGPAVWVLMDAHAIPDNQEMLQVEGVLTNIDRYKQTEQSLRQALAALREAQARARAIFDSTLTMTALLTPEGIVIEANQAALDTASLPPDEVIGKPFWTVPWWEKGEGIQVLIRDDVLRAAQGETRHLEVELRGPFRTATIDLSVRPIRNDDGTVTSLIAEGHDISMRREAEQARDESRARYSQIVENAAEGIWLFDEHNHAVYVNPRGAAMLGYTVEEATGKSPLSFTFPEDRLWVRQELILRARGQGEESELRLRCKDESERWVHYTVTRRTDAEGRYCGVLALVTDITEQHRAQEALKLLNTELESRIKERTVELESEVVEHQQTEAALRASEERYRRLVELSPDGICIHRGGRIIFINGAGQRLLGASSLEQVIGRSLLDFIHRDFHEQVRTRVREMVEENRPVPLLEEVFVRLDGTEVDVEVVAIPLNDGTGSVQMVFRDITERNRMVQELVLAQERFRAALKHVPITVFNQNRDLQYTWAYNQGGTAVSDLMGLQSKDISPDHGVELDEIKRNVINSGVGSRQEVRARASDGRERIFDLVVEPLLGADGKVNGVTCASIDITEYRQSEERVRQLNAKLQKHTVELEIANRELESFSYSVSHDLRAPLASIDGFSRLLSQEFGSVLSEQGQRYLRLVRDNAATMDRLIQDLLAFSRTSRQPLKRQSVAPSSVVRQVLEEQRPATVGRKIEFVLEELPACEADRAMLKQVYVNLISNALKFTRKRDVARIEIGYLKSEREEPEGYGESTIPGSEPVLGDVQLLVSEPDRYPNPETMKPEVVYFVKDNGVGFDMEQAERLFGVFQRLHSEEEYEGTGVGLAIVERVIHRHGGRIWAEAEVDQGAAFFFTLG